MNLYSYLDFCNADSICPLSGKSFNCLALANILKATSCARMKDTLDIKFIINSDDQYRLRVGNYRIIYTRDEQVFIIEIIKIGDRKDVYK